MPDNYLYNKVYTFQTWITTIFLAPIFMACTNAIRDDITKIIEYLGGALIFLPIGTFFSIPLLIVAYILFRQLIKFHLSSVEIKLIYLIVIIPGIWGSFLLLPDALYYKQIGWYYSIASALSIFYFPVKLN